MEYRTFGWVQNPSNFDNLRKTVQALDPDSKNYKKLQEHTIKEVIYFEDIRDSLQSKLNDRVCEFTYQELVGKSIDKNRKPPKRRSDSVANSLLQISILPQSVKTKGKRYTDNWTADGFLRWAVSLNFISYNRKNDTFKITDFGRKYSRSIKDSKDERDILREAMLRYPPATRVMSLLANSDKPMTKFAIGSQLGFVGEKGFTSYDEKLMIDWLKHADGTDLKDIRANIEGTSDKYARMICGWLLKLDFVSRKSTKYTNSLGEKITGFPEYTLTGDGRHSLNQANGFSKNKTKPKFVMWEFFATDNELNRKETREYIRTRRAYTLKELKHHHTIDSILNALKDHGIFEEKETLLADLNKLITFGIRIIIKGNEVRLLDVLNDFTIPHQTFTLTESDIEAEKIKNYFRKNTNLPEKYLELLDIAFNNKRNRDFEIVTAGLFREVYNLESIHLGGANKPDGVIYKKGKFGIILDTKAYEKGYGKSINQIDEMVRYIEDNIQRDYKRNPNKWWENFDASIPSDSFYYLWVSGKFLPSFKEQLIQTNYRTKINGGGIEVRQLLLGANAVKNGILDVEKLPMYMKNNVISFVE